MKRRSIFSLFLVSIVIFGQLILPTPVASASDTQTVYVKLVTNENQTQKEISGVRLYYWKIDNSMDNSDKAKATWLSRMSILQNSDYTNHQPLIEHYGKAMLSDASDNRGVIALSLPFGTYYVLSEAYPNSNKFMAPMIIVANKANTTTIVSKHISPITPPFPPPGPNNVPPPLPPNPKLMKGDHIFMKVGEKINGVPLAGAKFRVLKKENGQYVPVVREQKDYIVESDKAGLFFVTNLPFGEYYLKEIVSPKHYKLLSDVIPFEIDNNLSTSECMQIINKRDTGKKITIPKTGDFMLSLLCLVGCLFFFVGYRLVKEK